MRALRNLGSALQRRTPRRPAVGQIDHPASDPDPVPVPVLPPSKNSISRRMMNADLLRNNPLIKSDNTIMQRKTMGSDCVSNTNYSTKAMDMDMDMDMDIDVVHMHPPRLQPFGKGSCRWYVDTEGLKKNPFFKKCIKFALNDYNRNRKMCGKQQIELVKVTWAARLANTISAFEIHAIDKIDGILKNFSGKVCVNGTSFTLMYFRMVGPAD